MNLDYSLDQGLTLTVVTNDVQSHGGVCHAVTTEWVINKIVGTPTQLHPGNDFSAWSRAISQQRAYGIFWQDALRDLWSEQAYHQYLNIALPPTEEWVATSARRSRPPLRVLMSHHFVQLNQLALQIQVLTPSSGLVIVMTGSDPVMPVDVRNWGHTVGVARDAAGHYYFLDANSGQYSAATRTRLQTAQFIVTELTGDYGPMNVRDIHVYPVSA